MTKTQEIIDYIEKHGNVRLSTIRKEFKLPPSSVRAFLATAIRKGWVLNCALTSGEGEEHDEEYRIGTAYTRAAAASLADDVPTFPKVSLIAKPGSNPLPKGEKPAPPPNPPAVAAKPTVVEDSQETSIHKEHARELLEALNRIHALEGELHEARLPANWDTAAMIQQLQYHLADGVEFLIGPTRLHLLDGDARYEVTNPAELLQTLDSIRFLKQRKVA